MTELLSPEQQPAILKLQEVKQQLKLIAADYDGTLHSNDIGHMQAAELLAKSAVKGTTSAIVTARDATIQAALLDILLHESATFPLEAKPIYIAKANGASTLKIENGNLEYLYRNDLDLEEIQQIAELYKSTNIIITAEDDRIRQNDLQKDWNRWIPDNIKAVSANFTGVWAEPSKVTLLMPDNQEKQLLLIDHLQKSLPSNLVVQWGGKPLLDVTKKLETDGKLYAVKAIMDDIGATELQTATFGDTPAGNDRYLLSLPYSFTNTSHDTIPPYLLPAEQSKVHAVHKAVNFLLQ